jgi:hypothetical protein
MSDMGPNSEVIVDFEDVRFDTGSGIPSASAQLKRHHLTLRPSHPQTLSPSPHLCSGGSPAGIIALTALLMLTATLYYIWQRPCHRQPDHHDGR